jgi:60 kDa SS-A/Ro ribonucleoprotein
MPHPRDMLTVQPDAPSLPDHFNPEGYPAFTRSLEERYQQMLLTNTLSGTFYAHQQTLIDGSLELHLNMTSEQPELTAQMLVTARQNGMMRLQPIVGLAFLSATAPKQFEEIFDAIIQTPGDLEDFVAILRGGTLPVGLTRKTKRVINKWLNQVSEYHAIKYANALKKIMRLTHPKPSEVKQASIFAWLHDRKGWRKQDDRHLVPQIMQFEALKQAVTAGDKHTILKTIREGKLPYEVVTGVIQPDLYQWQAMIRQMPYFALLRHLNTFQRHRALYGSVRYIAERLRDVNAMRKAKILPFRLLTAYEQFAPKRNETAIQQALLDAMDIACDNLPSLGDKVCIAPDVSWSMSGRISDNSTTRYIDIAGLFASALYRQSDKALILPFNHDVLDFSFDGHHVLDNARSVGKLLGGGTEVRAPIEYLIEHRIAVDTFIGITDNIEWHHGSLWRNRSNDIDDSGFLGTWRKYKRDVAPEARAYLITIAPYRSAVAPDDEPDVHYIYGWSESVLRYISLMSH